MLKQLTDLDMGDISPDWKGSTDQDRVVLKKIQKWNESPRAAVYFAEHAHHLSDYWYWYTLGTLWVLYSGHTDLAMWRRLFSSTRPNRETSLMKPSELQVLAIGQGSPFTVYRAHRPNEKDWLAYTLDPQIAARFARERGVSEVKEYEVDRADVFALFLRRREAEVLVLDRTRVRLVRAIDVAVQA